MFRDRDGWRVQWTEDKARRSKKFETKVAARLFEAQLKAGGPTPDSAKVTVSVAEFSDLWLERYCKTEKAESQWYNDESAIRAHIKPALGHLRLAEVTKAHLTKFRADLKAKPIAVKTVNLILALAKKIFKTAVEWEYLAVSPGVHVKLFPQTEQAAGHWLPEERDRFWALAPEADLAFSRAILVACHTGLRRGELAGLRRRHLDFERRLIEVNAVYCFKGQKFLARTKNKKLGWVPMNDVVFDALASFQGSDPEALIFGPALLLHAARRLRKMCVAIKVKSIRFHDLRHTFGSALAMAGIEKYRRQMLMRHKTGGETDRYSHLEPGYLAEGVQALTRNTARKGVRNCLKA